MFIAAPNNNVIASWIATLVVSIVNMRHKMKFMMFILSVTFLMLLAQNCRCDLRINMIPEEYEAPNGRTGSFFGASVALHSQSIYTGAPYWSKSDTGAFKCPLEQKQNKCVKGTFNAGIHW